MQFLVCVENQTCVLITECPESAPTFPCTGGITQYLPTVGPFSPTSTFWEAGK